MPSKQIPHELEIAVQKMMDDGVPEESIKRVMTLYMDAHDTVGGQFLNEMKGTLEGVPSTVQAAVTAIPEMVMGLSSDAVSLFHGETPTFTKGVMDAIGSAPDWWKKFTSDDITHEERGQMLSPLMTGALVGRVAPLGVKAGGRGLAKLGSAVSNISPASQEAIGVVGGGLLGASAGGPGTMVAGAASGSWAGPRMIRGLGRAMSATGEAMSGEASPATAAASATAEGNAAKVANTKFKAQVKQWRDEARSMKKTETGLAARETTEKAAADEAKRLAEAQAATEGKDASTTVTERTAGKDAQGRAVTKTTKFTEPKPELSPEDDTVAALRKAGVSEDAIQRQVARGASVSPAGRPAIQVRGPEAAKLAAPGVPVEPTNAPVPAMRVQPSPVEDALATDANAEAARQQVGRTVGRGVQPAQPEGAILSDLTPTSVPEAKVEVGDIQPSKTSRAMSEKYPGLSLEDEHALDRIIANAPPGTKITKVNKGVERGLLEERGGRGDSYIEDALLERERKLRQPEE